MAEYPYPEAICFDNSELYPQALVRLRQAAMERSDVLYLYSDGVFFRMTNEWVKGYLAKAFPGGRLESKRAI